MLSTRRWRAARSPHPVEVIVHPGTYRETVSIWPGAGPVPPRSDRGPGGRHHHLRQARSDWATLRSSHRTSPADLTLENPTRTPTGRIVPLMRALRGRHHPPRECAVPAVVTRSRSSDLISVAPGPAVPPVRRNGRPEPSPHGAHPSQIKDVRDSPASDRAHSPPPALRAEKERPAPPARPRPRRGRAASPHLWTAGGGPVEVRLPPRAGAGAGRASPAT